MPIKPKLNIADARMINVIDSLMLKGIIRYRQEFLDAINMKKQQYRGIKVGEQSFTAEKIRLAKKAFPMINLDYVLGSEKNVFLSEMEEKGSSL